MAKHKKRPYFKTAARVISVYDRHPKLTSTEIGMKLGGLHPAYVRKALARNGRKLFNARS